MWLLNVHTSILEYFIGDSIPPYAILSHTWGDGEVSFKDMQDHPKEAVKKPGYRKIKFCCQQAHLDGWSYAWVDTCCIDKNSSVELSENINSMYHYYRHSKICYVYLSDVQGQGFEITDRIIDSVGLSIDQQDADANARHEVYLAFTSSRWFTRGWCLQELLASKYLNFYDHDWKCLAHKQRIIQILSRTTSVDAPALAEPSTIPCYCVARKMCWAAQRSTTRAEDLAYSLLGIFEVNMPLLYGEGGLKAFDRLQREIIRTSTDQSIFAWDHGTPSTSLLADSPARFSNAGKMILWSYSETERSFSLSNVGLKIETPLIMLGTVTLAVLNCRFEDELFGPICLKLTKLEARKQEISAGGLVESSGLFEVGSHAMDKPGNTRESRLTVPDLEAANSANCFEVIIKLKSRRDNFRYPSSYPAHHTTFRPVLDFALNDQFQVSDAWPPPPNIWNAAQLVIPPHLNDNGTCWGNAAQFVVLPHLNDDGTCWGIVTIEHRRPPLYQKLSIGFLHSAPYSLGSERTLLSLVQHDGELPVSQMRQCLADSDHQGLSRIIFEHPSAQLPEIEVEILAPKMVMNSTVFDIRVSFRHG